MPALPRCWELRDDVTADDAASVALAELLQTSLVAADARLAHAARLRCRVEVLAPACEGRVRTSLTSSHLPD